MAPCSPRLSHPDLSSARTRACPLACGKLAPAARSPLPRRPHPRSNQSQTMNNHPTQFLLRLTHTVTLERSISMICIPDRDTAECELTRLRCQHGPRLLKAIIRKDRPGRSGTSRTHTLSYTVRET